VTRASDDYSIAAILDELFKGFRPGTKGPAYEEVAQVAGIAASTVKQLRTGARSNPTMSTIDGLATFFRVPPGDFFKTPSDEHSADDSTVQYLAHLARGLSRESLSMIIHVVEQSRALEGLPPNPGSTHSNG